MKKFVIVFCCVFAIIVYGHSSNSISASHLLFYNSSGPIQDYRCFVSGPVLTASDGTWSISIASSSISSVKNIQISAISPIGAGATSQLVPVLNPNVGTTFSGKVMSGTGILLLGASSLVPVTSAVTINLEVCGN